MLLAPLGPVSIQDIRVAATTNDVFQVTTEGHGTYYVKFHTARYYADQPDTFFVVERECAVATLLHKRGLSLPYRAWGDYTRTVVPRSVYICERLNGLPLPDAVAQHPDQAADILRAFGGYMKTLHGIEFTRPGILSSVHAYFAPPAGVIPAVCTWEEHSMHHPEVMQREAMELLEKKGALLPDHVLPRLSEVFQSLADVIRDDYSPPRFTVGNCHAWHFHVTRQNGQWKVLGFYDFEACSAGDATLDLLELEITLTPALKGTTWRDDFFEGYGHRPEFDGYRRRLLCSLLNDVGKSYSRLIPDPAWLNGQWENLIDAADWNDLTWYPENE